MGGPSVTVPDSATVGSGVPPRERGRSRPASSSIIRRRRIAALLAVAVPILLLAIVLGTGGDDEPGDGAEQTAAEGPARPELPRGGRRLFPEHRLVAFYGAPQNEELGALGIGTPAQAAKALERQARPYELADRRRVLPTFELLATIANAAPGDDGKYRTRQDRAVIDEYLRAARKESMLLLLDVQPGRADFPSEVRALEPWLRQPDVGLALDPEWRMGPTQVPAEEIGAVDASEVNAVSAYLADLVRRYDLPEKLLLIHQFTGDMVRRKARLVARPGVVLALNVDGFGTADQKIAKYRELTGPGPTGMPRTRAGRPRFPAGFKLFYKEDTGLMTPRQVLGMRPQPEIVSYE